MDQLKWWQEGIVYEIYPRSFQDSNKDGIGDIPGIMARLDYLKWLGVTALWIAPFYPSPMKDFGYDISDYCNIDPMFGTLADFEELIRQCHKRDLKIILDLVANHTSDEHPWFQEALANPNSIYRDYYVWQDPDPDNGPPNNWQSIFGGSAWSKDETSGQYYLHQFLSGQPDLNYRNPRVLQEILSIMRFWYQKGVDGFRLDAIQPLVEDERFLDEPINPDYIPGQPDHARHLHVYTLDQPETHHVLEEMRKLSDSFEDRVLIGEVYVEYPKLMRYYGTNTAPQCHLPFNFRLITDAKSSWTAETIAQIVAEYEQHLPVDGWPNWVIGNHDQSRVATRVGVAGAKLGMVLLMTLRGTPTLYYGDELGLPDGIVPPEKIQDPAGIQQKDVPGAGRDPERTPMQWDSSRYAGFSKVEPWLPVQDDYEDRNVAVHQKDQDSFLSFSHNLIQLRQLSHALKVGAYQQGEAPKGVLAYLRIYQDEVFEVILNFNRHKVKVDLQGDILLSTHQKYKPDDKPTHLQAYEAVILRKN